MLIFADVVGHAWFVNDFDVVVRTLSIPAVYAGWNLVWILVILEIHMVREHQDWSLFWCVCQ